MTENSHSQLHLEMDAAQLAEFYPLLQQGVGVVVRVGCPLSEILSGQLGIPADYVAGRITTIFLNHRPVDDLNRTIVREGAMVALSGAMPGLVGATMRRGGYYGAMRGGITHEEGAAGIAPRTAVIGIKLFNLLLPELGPGLLRRGVVLDPAQVSAFLTARPATFWAGCHKVLIKGMPLEPSLLAVGSLLPADQPVTLTVVIRGMP